MKHILITSWDDTSKSNYRLADLLSKYKLPGIFYLDGLSDNIFIEQVEYLTGLGFEVGGHTVSHPKDMKRLTDNQKRDQIRINKEWLEKVSGNKVTKFAYPKGKYDISVIKILQELGFTDGRTVDVMCLDEPNNRFKTKTSFHIHPYRKEYDGKYFLDVGKKLIDKWAEKGGRLEIWGHADELDRYNLWDKTEELLKYVKNIHTL